MHPLTHYLTNSSRAINRRCEWTLNKEVKAEISKDTSTEEHTKELKLHPRPIGASGPSKWGLCCKILNRNIKFGL